MLCTVSLGDRSQDSVMHNAFVSIVLIRPWCHSFILLNHLRPMFYF